MQQKKLAKVKVILTSEYWLLFTLSGVFFCFFARGEGANLFAELCGIFLLIELILGSYRIKQIHRWHLVFAAICAYLVLASVLNPYAYSKLRYMKRLVRMVLIVFAMHCLSQKDVEDRIAVLFGGLLAVSVCWQFAARYLYQLPFGTYTNPHYLASFAALALPLILYFFLANTGWYKLIFIPVGILDVILLLEAGSFPAYLAIISGTVFLCFLLAKGWQKLLAIILIFTILAILYVTDYPITRYTDPLTKDTGAAISMKDFILTLSKEERIILWIDTWKMLRDNSLIAWIIGNGIGSFRESFAKYVSSQYKGRSFVFAHSYFLDILFQHGIVGFALIFGGLGFLFCAAITKIKGIVNKRKAILLKCMITLSLIWFIHCGLAFPFYSNYSLIPLAFILGTMLVLFEKIPRAGVLDQDSRV